MPTRGVLILIPAHGAADRLLVCLESLAKYAPLDSLIWVLDDATPDDSISLACTTWKSRCPQLNYLRSSVNRGFGGTCNWGNDNLRSDDTDLLLLNSDTEVTEGFLEEMQSVLYLHERHAVVTPRSNSATIFSVPSVGSSLSPAESYESWKHLRILLPRYQVMPTAVGFCMLIKAAVLRRFKLFDDIYSPGYNEENDFVCRINRCGYSALAANHVFVFHHEGSSFSLRRTKLETEHREILLGRFPEYPRSVSDHLEHYLDPIERFAPLYVRHRKRVCFDCIGLPSWYCGTTEFALNLLRGISEVLDDEFEVHVGIGQSQAFFAEELAAHTIIRDPDQQGIVFDMVFRPAQVFTWQDLYRMNRLAPRVTYVLLDIIGVRCAYLNSVGRQLLFRKTAQLSDLVFAISEFSRSDFCAFYGLNQPMQVIHLGTNFGIAAAEFRLGEYILLMGNVYAHKGVTDALEHLGAKWPIVVLGGEQPVLKRNNVRWLTSGSLTRQEIRELFVQARMLVYPSHYEGFGLPIVDALALGKPVVVLDTAVNRELGSVTGEDNLFRIASSRDLASIVGELFDRGVSAPQVPPRRWADVAREYIREFTKLLAQDVCPSKLRDRWDLLRTLESRDSF